MCPHVLFDKDIFNILFLNLLKLLQHTLRHILDLVRDVYEDAKGCIMKHGCLPRIKDDTRLLVVHDEAQFLGDHFSGSFQSMSSSDKSPPPLLSPIGVETVSSSVTLDVKSPGDLSMYHTRNMRSSVNKNATYVGEIMEQRFFQHSPVEAQ